MGFAERPGAVKGAPTGAAQLPLTARTVLKSSMRRERRAVLFKSILETQNSIDGGDVRVSTMVLSETRGPIAFFGCPRGHRVKKETSCLGHICCLPNGWILALEPSV